MINAISYLEGLEGKSGRVAAEIARRVRRGDYRVGDALPSERELTEQFGVGRSSIREALFMLSSLGIAETRSGHRPRVTKPSTQHLLRHLAVAVDMLLDEPGGVAHLEQMRVFVETSLVRYAATRATNAQIEQLRHALRNNAAAIGQHSRFVETDVAFHRIIAEISGNPIAVATHDAFVAWLISQRPDPREVRKRNQISYDAHKQIFDAILAGDGDRASEHMGRHLNDAYRLYLSDGQVE